MSSSYEYYTKLRKECGGFTIELDRLLDRVMVDDIDALSFKDTEVFSELPQNLGNYYSWAAIEIKKHMKSKYGLTGVYKCTFYCRDKRCASIVINCDSSRDLDAFVFQ